MTVLCYHAVHPEWTSPLSMHPATFAAHCRWLDAHRDVLDLDMAVQRMSPAGRLPGGTAAVTFDDGFASVHDHAWPILTRHRLPATVFLVAQTLTETGQPVDWIDTAPPYESDTLTLDQVLEMQQGGVAFQSHSYRHADLTQLSYAECLADLRQSRDLLESLLGRSVRFLAYPRGRHAPHVREAAEKAGYSHAFALPEGPEPVGSHALPRVGLYRGNGVRGLQVKAARSYLPVRTGRAFQLARRAKDAVGGRGR